ncbi:glycine zipper 2TM domain-containing protein [Sphingomonas sp.]|uniref:glycine zipper 2TM domain-containing protein n=1 Tax=Sphingomonas sp. TaxID=28214 RepID=UPI0031DF8AF6
MFKKLSLIGAALAMTGTALIPATPAAAQRYEYRDDRGYGDRGYRSYRGYDRRYNNRYNRYRAREKCRDGDGGTIVGAIAGGLAGNAIAGRGDRTLGTILGGAVGAIAGREIDRSDRPGYCRR